MFLLTGYCGVAGRLACDDLDPARSPGRTAVDCSMCRQIRHAAALTAQPARVGRTVVLRRTRLGGRCLLLKI
jgi:hypothetical protein